MDNRNSICGVPFTASGDGATGPPFRLPRKRDQDEIDGPWERARGAGITFFSLEVTRGERGDRPPPLPVGWDRQVSAGQALPTSRVMGGGSQAERPGLWPQLCGAPSESARLPGPRFPDWSQTVLSSCEFLALR